MHVSKELKGHLVAIQLARPTYAYEYGAHLSGLTGSYQDELLVPQPIVTCEPQELELAQLERRPPETRPTTRDALQAVLVHEVGDDFVAVDMLVPDRSGTSACTIRKTIPSSLIVAIDEVVAVDVDLPTVTRHVRAEPQPAPPQGRVTLK